MKKTIILCLALALFATPVLASTTSCTYGSQERVISVVYLVDGQKVPCEVQYSKNGETETTWSAQSEEGYCEEKAKELVEKQVSWGWSCKEAATE